MNPYCLFSFDLLPKPCFVPPRKSCSVVLHYSLMMIPLADGCSHAQMMPNRSFMIMPNRSFITMPNRSFIVRRQNPWRRTTCMIRLSLRRYSFGMIRVDHFSEACRHCIETDVLVLNTVQWYHGWARSSSRHLWKGLRCHGVLPHQTKFYLHAQKLSLTPVSVTRLWPTLHPCP